jgi:GT2 family glycosyltransferase
LPHTVHLQIVTFNSSHVIAACLESLAVAANDLAGEIKLQIEIIDNGGTNGLEQLVSGRPEIKLFRNEHNLGFCAAHNQGVARFLDSNAQYLFLLNPDTELTGQALREMLKAFQHSDQIGAVTPKLLRKDRVTIDAAGMFFTSTLRHLDRGSNQPDQGQYDSSGFVPGGTGAALMLSRVAVERLVLDAGSDEALDKIYPQLQGGREIRKQLFDEAFFAYRDDAELAWRAQLLGIRYWYAPSAVVYHGRVVTPERREALDQRINSWSVRNRFLMQFNNFTCSLGIKFILNGLIIWNFVVIIAVLFKERSSLAGLVEAVKLTPRALNRRREVLRRSDLQSIKKIANLLSGKYE